MERLTEYLLERLSDVKAKWHPKEGLFTSDNPDEIAGYLLKHSEDRAQAMRRLNFYINRAGKNLKNRDVLEKAKKIIEKD
jgi:hypothetical protein